MKKTYFNSFCARCLTLLVLALLSTNLAWGTTGTIKIIRSSFPSGELGYNITDNWSVTASTGETISGEGDLYSSKDQTTMQSKNSGVSTMYHNTVATPGPITKITLKCASGTTRTYTAYMNKTTAITSTSGGTSKGTIAPTAGNTASLSLEADDNWHYFWLNLAGGASYLDYIEIEYMVEDGKTLSSVAISGTPTKIAYETGESFDVTGLTVIGTYDASTADLTDDVEWTINPAKFTSTSQTSVSVTATVDGKTDTKNYNVTVSEHVVTPGTYEIALNKDLYGITTAGNVAKEQSAKAHDITVVSGCASNAQTKTSYQAEHIRYYASSYLKLSVPAGYEITSVVFTEPTSSSQWDGSITSTPDSYNASTKTWTGSAQEVKFDFGKQNRIASIKITYTTAKAKTLKAISVSGQKTTFYKGDKFEFGGKVVASYNEEDVDDEDVTSKATFTGYDMSTAGTQTITVTYEDKTTTYDIIVKTIANTKETAYTTAEAIALIDAGKDLTTSVYVKGKISKIDSYNDTYKSITYWLDNNTFEVYSGKGLDNTDFSSVDDIAAGANVVVYGIIKKYESTYEFDKNNYLVSYTAPTKEMPTITATYKESLNVGEDDEFTVEYNGDGDLSITSSDEEVAEAIIEGNEVLINAVASGTTTITISAAETDDYYATSITYTLTVVGPASLPFAFDGGVADIANTNGMSQSGLGSDYSSSPKLKFDNPTTEGVADNLIIWFNGQAAYVSYDIKGNGFSGGTFDVLESADGKTYTSVASYTELGNSAATETKNLLANTRYVKFVYTKKSSGNVALGNIKIDRGQDVAITAAKYATLGLPYAVEIPTGVSAYTATVEGTTVTMTKIQTGKIPANCGVILYADVDEATTYTFTETADIDLAVDNQLVAVVSGPYTCTGEDVGKVYYLGKDGENAIFKKLNENGTIAAGKAYLKLDAALSSGAKLDVTFGEPTGITSYENDNENENLKSMTVYNLNGVRVNEAYKGIVIMNGKKYINK